MSTPLVPITENTFILPLIGNLTDERFEKITETVISSMNISRADYLILDLSGLGTFNENTSPLIFRLNDLLKLLGTEMILTGISAKLAMKAAGSNNKLSSLTTFSSVQEAVKSFQKNE
ncbi:STAS domain-containing protein [Fictibacillus sp. KIGAM418]|uniref:STAS domain-containing protein n=1 Tax=Fictibacillus marinisediminis TaxID=2878389 RepID=A0A9X1X8Q3_9BACL|nr:STAS domain-containing protein [Fictibacillus marinisediminis]MCK6256071.1 STAS domain-containing protein [Fictibacillus marinisediminis]